MGKFVVYTTNKKHNIDKTVHVAKWPLASIIILSAICHVYNSRVQMLIIIESVDSISKDERGFPLTQYITNGRISRCGYTFTYFKHHHRVLRLISYSMSV